MSRRFVTFVSLNILVVLGLVATIAAQEPAKGAKGKGPAGAKGKVVAARPGLFFREVWKQLPTNAEHPLDQTAVASPDLELTILNNTGEGMMMTGTTGLEGNPPHMWTGVNTGGPSAATFKHKTKFADLTGLARIKANIKSSGFHQVRPVVRLASGTYLVADQGVGTFTDWLNYEWAVADLRWLTLDPKRVVTTGTWVLNPDLSKVDEIGFADLMPGSGHGAGGWVDVAEVEVYANSVAR